MAAVIAAFWLTAAYIEGIRFVLQAIRRQVQLETLIFSAALLSNPVVYRVIREQRRAGVPCLEVTPELCD